MAEGQNETKTTIATDAEMKTEEDALGKAKANGDEISDAILERMAQKKRARLNSEILAAAASMSEQQYLEGLQQKSQNLDPL